MRAFIRFKQAGSWRLLRTLARMGLAYDVMKMVANILLRRKDYKQEYAKLMQKVEPLLADEFERFFDDNQLGNRKITGTCQKGANTEKYVWFCWLQGIDSAPDIVKACLESQEKWIKDRTFVIITADNYREYISLPKFIEEKFTMGIISNVSFSDLLRVELLIRYGGTWIDSTVMITGRNFPEEILDCPIFMPQYIGRDGQSYGISNWMITAYKDNHLLIALREMLFEYWRRYDCLIDYYMFHLFFGIIARKYSDDVANMPILNSFHCIELLKHLGEDGKSEKLQRFLSKVSIHKLSFRLKDELFSDENNVLHELLKLQ